MSNQVNNMHIRSLTGIRFYAAVLVFVSHLELFHYFLGITEGPLLGLFKELGTAGVSLFFVLSGFILFVNYLSPEKRSRFSAYPFYVARLARVYPMFFISILFALPIIYLSEKRAFDWFGFFINITPLKYVYPQVALINIPTWTIYVEGFFYAVFPLLGFLFLRQVKRNVILFIVLFIIYVIIIHILFPNSQYITAGYFPLNRLLEFFSGMALGYAFTNHRLPVVEQWLQSQSSTKLRVLFLSTFALILLQPFITAPLFQNTTLLAQDFNFYYYLPLSLLLIMLIAVLERQGKVFPILAHQFIILGGEVSYAFYLLHRPLLEYSVLMLESLFGIKATSISLLPGVFLTLLLLIVCFCLSYFAYRFIETSCRFHIKKLLSGNSTAGFQG